jgi:pimeloyl-ACP methyl ester carboxylesterase
VHAGPHFDGVAEQVVIDFVSWPLRSAGPVAACRPQRRGWLASGTRLHSAVGATLENAIMLRISRVLLAFVFFAATSAFAVEDREPEGRLAKVDDIDMYYLERGAGAPLVLLHGFGGCGKNWEPFVDQLASHHRLIIVDLRGHGHSTNAAGTFTHRRSARDVYALLDSLQIDRFAAMGISSGGMTLLHMAASQPGRVSSMVLIGATSHFPEQARSILREASVDNMPPDVLEIYRECATRGDEQVRELVTQFRGFHESHDDMAFTADDLSRIPSRAMIVHGDRDPFFPVEIAVNMYRALPNASLWIIPEGDHVPIYAPSVPFAATALRFLDGPGPTSGSDRR